MWHRLDTQHLLAIVSKAMLSYNMDRTSSAIAKQTPTIFTGFLSRTTIPREVIEFTWLNLHAEAGITRGPT